MAEDLQPSVVELVELLARVETASGPDRELDALVCAALRHYPNTEKHHADWVTRWAGEWRAYRSDHGEWLVAMLQEGGVRGPNFPPPNLTASLDAALALVERVLPGKRIQLDIAASPDIKVSAFIGPPTNEVAGAGHTPALALLAALLRAIIAADADTSERNDLARDDDKAKPSTSLGGDSRASVADQALASRRSDPQRKLEGEG